MTSQTFEIVIVGGTPGGLMAAIAAARRGHTAVILERNQFIGGLPTNGLGATDIQTRGATGGLFLEFVSRVKRHYSQTYGEHSPQVDACAEGYRFEPSVAQTVFEQWLLEYGDLLTVRCRRQFDANPSNVCLHEGCLTQITLTDLETDAEEHYPAKVFIDGTYEGDLAAASGVSYYLGREDATAFDEPMAGKTYQYWNGPLAPHSTGRGDNAIQAYNYRLPLTCNPEQRIPITKPKIYDRNEFISLVDDLQANRTTYQTPGFTTERETDGIGRLVNLVPLPNDLFDANNQHASLISTDLAEENWPWPMASWAWRDQFAQRLRDYTLGLIWFAQNDAALPQSFRQQCQKWGLAKDQYIDNEHFPRQVYVREGRRIDGDHLFTAHDALPTKDGDRPPIHADSITACHYQLDSHAVLKREKGRPCLDGFFKLSSRPYTVPYGVIMPKGIEGLLTPVPVSGTHIGFSTLRMEPCWMALGQAAGIAACLAVEQSIKPRNVPIDDLQHQLVLQGAVLIYFKDAQPGDDHYWALTQMALRGVLGDDQWAACLHDVIDPPVATDWVNRAGINLPHGYQPGVTTRGELLELLHKNRTP